MLGFDSRMDCPFCTQRFERQEELEDHLDNGCPMDSDFDDSMDSDIDELEDNPKYFDYSQVSLFG